MGRKRKSEATAGCGDIKVPKLSADGQNIVVVKSEQSDINVQDESMEDVGPTAVTSTAKNTQVNIPLFYVTLKYIGLTSCRSIRKRGPNFDLQQGQSSDNG